MWAVVAGRRVLCACGLLGALAGAAGAQGLEPICSGPALYTSASVNVVVLPYEAADAATSELAARVTGLMQLQALFHLAPFPNIGVLHGMPASRVFTPCASDDIASALVRQSEPRDGQGLVILTGRVFLDGADLHVQSYLTFQRRGLGREVVQVKVADRAFTGHLSAQTIELGPQRIALADLDRRDQELRSRAVLRQQSSDTARATPLFPREQSLPPTAFLARDVFGPWTLVEVDTQATGWIRSSDLAGSDASGPVFKEVPLLEAVVGFLRLRQEQASDPGFDTASLQQRITSAVQRFLSVAEGDDDAWATAVALQLGALPALATPSPQVERVREAHRALARAADGAPESADARGLELIARLYLGYEGGEPGFHTRLAADSLRQAAALAPADAGLVANLRNFYQLALSHSPPDPAAGGDLAPEEIVAALTATQLTLATLGGEEKLLIPVVPVRRNYLASLMVDGSQPIAIAGLSAGRPYLNFSRIDGSTNPDLFRLADYAGDLFSTSEAAAGIQFARSDFGPFDVPTVSIRTGANALSLSHSIRYGGDRAESNNIDDALRSRLAAAPGAHDNRIAQQHSIAGSLGGPILKDHAWFMIDGGWEKLRARQLGALNGDGSQGEQDRSARRAGVRLDVQASSRVRVTPRYAGDWIDSATLREMPFVLADAAATRAKQQRRHHINLSGNVTATNSLLFEMRAVAVIDRSSLGYRSEVEAGAVATQDLARFTRVGAADLASTVDGRTFSVDGTASYVKSSYVFKAGVRASRQSDETDRSRLGDVVLEQFDGAPLQSLLSNTPLRSEAELTEWSAFVQDDWKPTHWLSARVGVRFEGVHGSIPVQASPSGTWVGTRLVDQRRVVMEWPVDISPRLGLTVSPRNGRTAVHGGYARFLSETDIGWIDRVNPNGFAEAKVQWTDRNSNHRLDAGELGPFTGFVGGPTTRWDRDARRPRADLFSIELEQQLWKSWSMSGAYRHTRYGRALGVFDLARLPTSYTPVEREYLDPLTGRRSAITVYDLDPALVGVRDRLATNISGPHSRSHGWTLEAKRSYRNGRYLNARLSIGRSRGLGYEWPSTSTDLNDPNALVHRTDVPSYDDVPWRVDLQGLLTLPLEIEVFGSYTARAGDVLRRSLIVSGLTQVSEDIHVVPRGTDRTESATRLINTGIRRRFTPGRFQIESSLEVWNLLNANDVTGQIDRLGSAWSQPLWVQRPRILRGDLKVAF